MFANNNDNHNHVRPILYYDDINPHSRAVLMLLNMLDVEVELRAIEMIKGEHLKPDYAKINPARTVPFLVHKDIVVTGNAIFSYVCENNDSEKAKQLLAIKCYKRHCRVLSRLFFESQVLHRIHGQLMTDLIRKTIHDTDVEYHRKKVESAYDTMETYLTDSPFFGGSVLTAADISFVACVGALDMMFPIAADAHRWEKLLDWFRRMRSLSVQKINVNGIEKQRRIVEYFAKFSFKSAIKRFTTGVRSSQIPRISLRHARCTTASQTDQHEIARFIETSPDINDIKAEVDPHNECCALEPRTVNTEAKDKMNVNVNEAALDAQKNTTQKIQEEPREGSSETIPAALTDAPAQIIDSIMPIDKHSTRASRDVLVPEYPAPPTEQEISEIIGNTRNTGLDTFNGKTIQETIDPIQYATSSLAERRSGGGQKEKPPVPPKRKKLMPIILEENTQNSTTARNEQQSAENPEEPAEPKEVNVVTSLKSAQRTEKQQNSNQSNSDKISKAYIPPEAESRTDSLSRLDGGVGQAAEKKAANKTPKLSKAGFPHAPQVIGIIERHKAKANTTLVSPKVAQKTIGKKSTSPTEEKKAEVKDKIISMEKSLLAPNLLNCPQVALQYCRGVNAPIRALPAPPPTPENSSQDDLTEAEFPPPPSEVLLQEVLAPEKVTQAAKVASTKTNTESLTRSLGKKSSGAKSARGTYKGSSQTAAVKPSRKGSTDKHKLFKKSSNGCLVASGTKSPNSNISQCSLLREKPLKVQKTTSGPSTTQMKDTDKPPHSQEKHRNLKTVQSLGYTTNGLVRGSALTTNVTTDAITKGAEKRQRAVGGGQKKSKERAPTRSAESQAELLRAALNVRSSVAGCKKSKNIITQEKPFPISSNEPADVVISISTVVEKLDCDKSNTRSAQNPPQSVSTATNTRLETLGKVVDVEPNALSALSNASPPNMQRNETKSTSAQTRQSTSIPATTSTKTAANEIVMEPQPMNQSELKPQNASMATNTRLDTLAKVVDVEPNALSALSNASPANMERNETKSTSAQTAGQGISIPATTSTKTAANEIVMEPQPMNQSELMPQNASMAANTRLETLAKVVDVEPNALSALSNASPPNMQRNETKSTSAQTAGQGISIPATTSTKTAANEIVMEPQPMNQIELMPQNASMATNTRFANTVQEIHTQPQPLTVAAENAKHKANETFAQSTQYSGGFSRIRSSNILPKAIDTQVRPASIEENPRKSSKNTTQGASTSRNTKSQSASPQPKRETKSTALKLSSKTNLKVYPTKLQTYIQTKTGQDSKTFDTSPYRPNTRPYKAQPRVETARKSAMKTKPKRGTTGSSKNSIKKPQAAPASSATISMPELDQTSALSSTQEVTSVEAPVAVNVLDRNVIIPSTKRAPVQSLSHTRAQAPQEVLQQSSSTVNNFIEVVEAQPTTTNPSPTVNVQLATNCDEVNKTIVEGMLVTASLVAKTLQTLNEVAKNAGITAPPLPPPLPPPPVAFQLESKRISPPIPPPMAPERDVRPTPGTVAKALQSLSAVTSEANPLNATAKPFRKNSLKPKNIEEPPLPEVQNVTPNSARPLAEILTASVRQVNGNKIDETTTNEIEIKKETQQSYKKSEKLSDKMGENVMQAAQQKMETNVSENIETVLSDGRMDDTPKLDTASVNFISAESKTFNFLDAPKAVVSGPQEPIAPSTSAADSVKLLEQNEKLSSSSILLAQERVLSSSLLAAGTDNSLLTESDTNPLAPPPPPPTTDPALPAKELYRKVIDMALLKEEMESLEPTPLPAQPNIFITGYTPAKPQTADQSFTGAGRALGSKANASRLRALSQLNGSALHGPSANVVISTFGYTPMSETDSTTDPLLPRYTLAATPTSSLPPLNSRSYTTITTNSMLQHHAEPVVHPTGRLLSPRPREYRPYPTAHRSSSLRGGERKIM